MKEIEVEIEVKDFKPIEEKLKFYGAKLEKEFLMRDVYFNREKFYRNIRIRLRELEDNKYLLTIKSPTISRGIQSAEEEEKTGKGFKQKYTELVKIHGEPVVDEILRVKIFRLEKSIIELREVKGLFNYVEISGKSEKDIENIESKLNIEGQVLQEGALNEVLKLRNLPKIVMK